MNKIDRYKIFIRYAKDCGIISSQKDLGEKLGYTNESSFSQVINEKVKIPDNFNEKLKSLVPLLNIEWLESGKGEMLLHTPQIITETSNSTIVGANVQGNGNNISNNDATNIAGMIELQHGYQAMLRKSQSQIDELLQQNKEQFNRFMSIIEQMNK